MPFLTRDEEVRIYYEARGEAGEWVTLINGYTRPLSDFKSLVRYLTERGLRVLVFDTRGVGKTDYPPVFTLEDLADDVLALWQELKIESSHVMGISFGGTIAITLAAKAPAQIKSLSLVSTAASEKYLSVESAGPSRNPQKFMGEMTKYFSAEFLAKNQMLVQGFIRQTAKVFQEPESALGARSQRDAVEGLDLKPLLSQITARTLILHGKEDRVVPCQSAEELNREISHSKLEILPGIGHLLMVEMPLKFYERIHQFVSEKP